MPYANNSNTEFLKKARKIVEENLFNELFGVSELAKELGISRSYLHRKIIAYAKLSVSQFIRQIRLKKAKELLRNTSSTVSEVAFDVGYSSVSYFSKCFRDYYGYSPGEVGKREEENVQEPVAPVKEKKKSMLITRLSGLVIVTTILVAFIYLFAGRDKLENTIAVIPFEYHGGSSENKNIIAGLGHSLHNHLSEIRYLSLPGYSSVLNYHSEGKLPNVKGKELRVNYLVEANGQKNGEMFILNVKLYKASTNTLLLEDNYKLHSDGFLTVESEMTQDIVKALRIKLSKQEEKQIERIKTANPIAYKFYLKGIGQLSKASYDYICNYQDTTLSCHRDSAMLEFEKATEYDPKFAHAYVQKAKIYAYLFMKDSLDSDDLITKNTDLAVIENSSISDSYIARAYVYEKMEEYNLAITFLNKALEINPNSAEAVGRLAHIYGFKLRTPDEFVYYALLNHKLNIDDNLGHITGRAMNYVTGIALQRMGLYEHVEHFLNKSLMFYPDAFTSVISIAHNKIYMGKNQEAITYFKEYMERCPEHIHYFGNLHGDLGNLYLMAGDYNNAALSFEKLKGLSDSIDTRYLLSYLFVNREVLKKEVFIEYLEKFKHFQIARHNPNKNIEKDRHLNLFRVHCLLGDTAKAMEYLRIMADEKIPELHIINELFNSPFYENLEENTEFKRLRVKLRNDFEDKQKAIAKLLQKKELLPAITESRSVI